jgi:hypothetical protein
MCRRRYSTSQRCGVLQWSIQQSKIQGTRIQGSNSTKRAKAKLIVHFLAMLVSSIETSYDSRQAKGEKVSPIHYRQHSYIGIEQCHRTRARGRPRTPARGVPTLKLLPRRVRVGTPLAGVLGLVVAGVLGLVVAGVLGLRVLRSCQLDQGSCQMDQGHPLIASAVF